MALTYDFASQNEKRHSVEFQDNTNYGAPEAERSETNILAALIRLDIDGTVDHYEEQFDATNVQVLYTFEVPKSGWYIFGGLDVKNWAAGSYNKGDIVVDDGKTYIASLATSEQPSITTTGDWKETKNASAEVLSVLLDGGGDLVGMFTQQQMLLRDVRMTTQLEFARDSDHQFTNMEEYNRLFVFDQGAHNAGALARYPQAAKFVDCFYDTFEEIEKDRN